VVVNIILEYGLNHFTIGSQIWTYDFVSELQKKFTKGQLTYFVLLQ